MGFWFRINVIRNIVKFIIHVLNYKPLYLLVRKIYLLFFILIFSCSKDEPPRYLLSVSASLGGAVSTTGGDYAEGKSVTITATANAEYQFVNWSNGSTQNPITITLMADQVLTANFAKVKYNLTLSTEGEGSISEQLISSGRVDYNSGSVVRLTATPAVGYSFTGWTGDLTSTDNPVEVDINSAKSITAVFDLIVVSLQVDIEGEGEVLEEIVTARSTDYNYGDTVKLTAQPAEGFDFISWSGDHTGEENPLEVTLTESKTIQANFDYELFNRVVGKWKIRKKADDKLSSWYMHSIIFRRNYSYTINSNVGQINGIFDVKSNIEIELVDYGNISGADLTEDNSESSTGYSFNFNISVPGEFEGEVESDVVENYQSEVSETGEIIEKTYVPDDNFEQALIDLGYDDALDNYVNSSNINQVTVLEISNKNISDLTGIEDFISLISLQADNMEISVLDVSNNIYLTDLSVHSNNLTELDISNNVNLTDLIINDNGISSIDLSNNTLLNRLIISGNNLTSIDLSSNTNLTNLELGNSGSGQTNQMTSIDLTNNVSLDRIALGNIGLSSIDLSKNINLTNLYLSGNQFTSLDVSNNSELETIYASHNQIPSLDFTNNAKLTFLELQDLGLTSLNVANSPELIRLYVMYNPLNSLDVSNNNKLTTLYASSQTANLSCIKVNSDQLANIPSDWTKDESAEYLTECTVCITESNVLSGSLTQTMTIGSPITPTEIILSSTCSDTTYTMSYTDNSVPGLIVSFTDNTINLSGAPAVEGTFDYSILVESTNLTYNQTSSTTLNGTITSNPPSLTATLTSGSQTQTVTATTSIAQVQYTYSTNYTGPINASASNLPPGISLSFSNNVATLSGTATTSGTYNYSITVSAASTNITVEGTITVNDGPQYGSSAVDQSNTTGGWGSGGSSQWQSFTVGVKGKLTAVQWFMSNPVSGSTTGQAVTFKVHSGEGDGGTLLATSSGLTTPPDKDENGDWAPHEFVSFDVSSYNILVDVNEVYTMKISIGAQDVGYLNLNIQNVYTRGRASNDASWDWLFKTFVAPQTN